jgi:lycopene cyclase domain-containing protein
MNEKYTYLLVDFFCIIFPLIFSFTSKFDFYRHWKSFAIPCLLVALFFIIWDIVFTWLGVWSFSDKYTIGIKLINLPIEEVLFFICIPYACGFSYYCFKKYFKFEKLNKFVNWFYLFLSVALLVVGLLNLNQLYTSVTFILLGSVLLYLVYKKTSYLPVFFVCYLFILIPFFISNGVLTGSFIDRVVVSYNENHNLGIRMLTIPFEDTFYGMLLLLLNTAGFEYFYNRRLK